MDRQDEEMGGASQAVGEFKVNGKKQNSLPSICIDGRLLDRDMTGVGHYAARLAETLIRHGQPVFRLDAVHPIENSTGGLGRVMRYARAAMPGVRTVARGEARLGDAYAGRLTGRDLFRQAYLHFKFRGRLMRLRCPGEPGIMHWTYPLPLYLEGWRNIYTVHDVIPIRSQHLSPVDGGRLRRLLDRIAERADRLVTVSENVRTDLVDLLECPPALVTACLQVGDMDAVQHGGTSADHGGHFLYCGAIEPRKNLGRLVAAYRASGSVRPFLIVGEPGWRADEVMGAIGDTPGVHIMPFQSREALRELMRGARAFFFPSLAEGFGLPVAEAMGLGVPILASSIAVLQEVAGEGALFVDPLDEAAMATAIMKLDSDDALCAQLGALGAIKAVAYQSGSYYRRLHGLYQDVARGAGEPRRGEQ